MNTVCLRDHGILPDTDVTLALNQLFSEYPENTEFVFENADYYFSPHKELFLDYRISNSTVMPYRVLGILMKHMKNCKLSGNGARLWFAGQMQAITLDRCASVRIENLTVNWKKPLVAEGEVVALHTESDGSRKADVRIDPAAFPHRLRENWLEFDVGADEWYGISQDAIAFEPYKRTVRRGTGDIGLGGPMVGLGDNIYRITILNRTPLSVGDILVLRHNSRIHAGVFSEKCEDLDLENITVHSCGGLGILAQFCHNLTYRGIHFVPDAALGRKIVNGRDDGFHLTCNSGKITVTECTFLGLMDDPINVHGCCVTSAELLDEKSVRCRYMHSDACGFHYWAEAGDRIAFIDQGNMSCIGEAVAESYRLEELGTFVLTFREPIARELADRLGAGQSLALDNLTHTAAFVCTKNRFGSCRARSVLVSTPKPVLIAENCFESSGSAVLVAGDSNYWYESGECHDVEIRDNMFTDLCLTSGYQFGEGVISICPVVPKPDPEKPYHKNIRIVGNTFDTADTPVLYGFSCEGLTFSGNRIFKSHAAEPWHPANCRMQLQYCNRVTVKDNAWVGKFVTDRILVAENCRDVASDVD